MLSEFKNELKVAESAHQINSTFAEDTVSKSTAQDWFTRFRTRDHDVEDRYRSGRPSWIHVKHPRPMVKDEPRRKTVHVAEAFRILQSTMAEHLRALGSLSDLWKWVPQELTKELRQCRVEAAVSLLSNRRIKTLLNSMSPELKSALYMPISSENCRDAYMVKT